ncbi:MAG: hypothetical protein IPJ65_28185 [Archangiaceae bacterium]|nr:hypothetical protein [Archangiaceae bacterium]
MTRLRIGHRARRPSTEERGAVESKPRFTRLQKASAAVATLAGAAALATHGADGPSLPSAPGPAADAKAFDALLEGYSSRQCSIYDTQPGSADLTPSDGWSGTLQIAVQAVDSGAPLSSAVIEDLCSVERSALAVPHQAEAASTTERDAAAVAVASVARIFSASVRAAPGEKTAAVDALVNATKGLSGPALVGHLTALKTAAAELEKRVRTPIAAEPGVVTAVLAAAPDPDAATTARPLSVADRKQVTAGYQRALDAARAGIEAAEARIVAEVVDGDYPRGVPAAVRAAIVTGVEAKGYDAVKAEAHLGYLKTPEALAAAMPGIVGAANEAAAEALFGADAPPEVIAAAQQEYLQGGTPESMLAAARAKVAAMPWQPSAMPVEIAPAGASQAEKLQYYLRLVNSVTDVRALPTDKPIALAIRGQSLDGSTHAPYNSSGRSTTCWSFSSPMEPSTKFQRPPTPRSPGRRRFSPASTGCTPSTTTRGNPPGGSPTRETTTRA